MQKLDKSQKSTKIDTTSHRHNNLIAKLDEQILFAQVMLKGEEYFGKKTVKQTDEDGNAPLPLHPSKCVNGFIKIMVSGF